MAMPTVAPMTMASPSPAATRYSEDTPLVTSSPSLIRSIQDAMTADSGGSAVVDTSSSRAVTSQAMASSSSGE